MQLRDLLLAFKRCCQVLVSRLPVTSPCCTAGPSFTALPPHTPPNPTSHPTHPLTTLTPSHPPELQEQAQAGIEAYADALTQHYEASMARKLGLRRYERDVAIAFMKLLYDDSGKS